MKQNTFLYVLRLALTLLIITSIMAAALAVVNRMTHSRIRENTDEKRGKAVAAVMTEGEAQGDQAAEENLKEENIQLQITKLTKFLKTNFQE